MKKEAAAKITKPDVEALINQRLQSGGFRTRRGSHLAGATDIPAAAGDVCQPDAPPGTDIEQLFEPLSGLNLDFSRNPSTGRPVDL